MKSFFSKVLIFIFPILIILIFLLLYYYISDPFKVVKRYSNYSNPITVLNRDYVSTETFLNNYSKYNYDTYVFGTSRTLGFSDLSIKRLFSDAEEIFYFDSSGEYINGVLLKLKLIDSLGLSLKNVFMVVCSDHTFTDNVSVALKSNDRKHLFLRHPIYGQSNHISFQAHFLKTFFKPKFLFSYTFYSIFKSDYFNLFDYLILKPINIDSLNNRLKISGLDSDIKLDSAKYYNERKHVFNIPNIDFLYAKSPQIDNNELNTLKEISSIFKKHSTSLIVVVSPLYKKNKLNGLDKILISNILSTTVHDFSGTTQFTSQSKFYYEHSHFKPFLGDILVDTILLRSQVW